MSHPKTERTTLFAEFPPVSAGEWEEVITKDLKGRDYKEKLRWQTDEGITPLPFYRREDISPRPPLKRERAGNAWEICETVFEQNIEAANKAALDGLDRGARALQFRMEIRPSTGMQGSDMEGTAVQSQDDFRQLLQDIPLEKTPVHFDAGMASPALLAMLWNEVGDQGLDPAKVTATFSYDPFSFILGNGRFPKAPEDLNKNITGITEFTAGKLPHVRPLCVDARTFHNGGATIIQELGLALSAASEYLAILTEQDIEPAKAAKHIHFRFGTGSAYFLEIAKFRAIRLLWQKLVDAYGGDPGQAPPYIHAETSRRNKTLYDPYTNMLRTTTEGMSAALGGCDSIAVFPFDETFRRPDDFSERIARNTQIILGKEAYFDKVADPSAGSYYIEQLTDEMAREAWEFFREVEKTGGLLKAVRDRFVQEAVEESREKRSDAIARRRRVFVGTNKYPNPGDEMAGKFKPGRPVVSLKASGGELKMAADNLIPGFAKALSDGARMGDLYPFLLDPGKENIRPLEFYRDTQAFDNLRMATEKSPFRPKVLCLPLGNARKRKARSAFAAGFFGCAGYEIVQPVGFEAVGEAVAAAEKHTPDIVVICSSDEEYEELVPALCTGLARLKNRPLIVLAGNSEEHAEDFRKAGVDEFIHHKCNVLETLKYFQTKLEVIKND